MELISRQVLDLWNKYKPTIAVDAIEYDRELKKLLGTNLAEVGTNCSEFPNNSDAISRQAAIKAIEDEWDGCCSEYPATQIIYDTTEAIERLPIIQSAEPKRGKWIHHPEIGYGETWLCDQCGEKTTSTVMGKPRANFCPNCGAKMEVNK